MSVQKIWKIIVFGICSMYTFSVHGQMGFDSEKANSLLHSLVNEGNTIGASAAISINGQTVWKKAAGSMNLKKNKVFTTTTKNRTASIAKSITAVAIMQLIEKGKIDLDVPIQTYLTEFPKKKLGDITTRHLLNHTSGIGGYKGKEANTREEYLSLMHAMTVFQNRALLFKPGSQYNYSSYGYVVLGAIIEQASDMRYSDYMQKYIFSTAGMDNTGIEVYKKRYDYTAEILHKNGKGKIALVKKINNLSGRIPAGGFYSTTEDLIAFGNALLNGSLISKVSMEAMFYDPQIRPKDDGNPYAQGWHIYNNKPPVGRIMGHSGGQYGTSSQLMVLPEMNTVVVIMANTSGSLNQVRNQSIRLIDCIKIDRDYTVSESFGTEKDN